jgi:hypothetical protein
MDETTAPSRGSSLDASQDEGNSFLGGDLVERAEARSRARGEELQPSESQLSGPTARRRPFFRTTRFPCTLIIPCRRSGVGGDAE